MDSYDIRFWDIKKIGSGSAARYRVRWAVNGREHSKSFKARPLADGFLTELKDAVRDRRPFDPRTGLPEAEVTEDEVISWYAHARAYAEAKWANLAPVSRRSVAEALVTVTIALSKKEPGAPDPTVLRQALFAWAFNPATRDITPPPHIAAALDWAERASLPVTDLEDTATVRLALGACAATLAGKPAAGSTQRRKRSVFYNALGYAVELGRLGSNPVDRIQWTAPAVAASVDRRVVVSPAQAGTLLNAVGRLGQRGAHLKAFFAVLYYAALRPSEAVMLREADLHLPRSGWGRIVLAASASRAGLDRRGHRPPGTRPEAPRRQRDPHHPRPPGPGRAAPRSHQAVRHDPGRAGLPDRPGWHLAGLRVQRGLGRGPQGSAHLRPVPVAAGPASV
jgi:integrase